MFDDNISTTSLPLNPLSYSPYSIIYGIQESFLGVCDAAMLEFVAPEPLNVKRWRCDWMRSRCNMTCRHLLEIDLTSCKNLQSTVSSTFRYSGWPYTHQRWLSFILTRSTTNRRRSTSSRKIGWILSVFFYDCKSVWEINHEAMTPVAVVTRVAAVASVVWKHLQSENCRNEGRKSSGMHRSTRKDSSYYPWINWILCRQV